MTSISALCVRPRMTRKWPAPTSSSSPLPPSKSVFVSVVVCTSIRRFTCRPKKGRPGYHQRTPTPPGHAPDTREAPTGSSRVAREPAPCAPCWTCRLEKDMCAPPDADESGMDIIVPEFVSRSGRRALSVASSELRNTARGAARRRVRGGVRVGWGGDDGRTRW